MDRPPLQNTPIVAWFAGSEKTEHFYDTKKPTEAVGKGRRIGL
jgi:hypothetical protein